MLPGGAYRGPEMAAAHEAAVIRSGGVAMNGYRIFRRAAGGTLLPIRGLVYTLLLRVKRCVQRSPETLVIKPVGA